MNKGYSNCVCSLFVDAQAEFAYKPQVVETCFYSSTDVFWHGELKIKCRNMYKNLIKD